MFSKSKRQIVTQSGYFFMAVFRAVDFAANMYEFIAISMLKRYSCSRNIVMQLCHQGLN